MSLKRSLRSSTRAKLDSTIITTGSANEPPSVVSAPNISVRRKPSKRTKSNTKDGSAPIDSPSTPPAKRAKRAESSPAADDREAQLSDRPAEPHRTNATLKTPGGSRLVPFSKAIVDSSPIKGGLPVPTTTTRQLLDQACEHLISVDARMKPLIERYHCKLFSPEGLAEVIDPFESLCSGIMSQQVSGAAANSIKNKFIALFQQTPDDPKVSTLSVGKAFPKPSQVVTCSIPFLRTAGLSERKAEYIQGLAEKFHCEDLTAKMLMKASDEEVLEKLVAVRGLGRWSVEMFACFGLKRLDVLSTGDLGVQRGMAAFIGKDVKKLKSKGGKWKYLSEKEMIDISAPFAPYRSLFMWYMWRVEDVDTDAFA